MSSNILYLFFSYNSFEATSKHIMTSSPALKPALCIADKISSMALSSLSSEGAKPPSSPTLLLKFF